MSDRTRGGPQLTSLASNGTPIKCPMKSAVSRRYHHHHRLRRRSSPARGCTGHDSDRELRPTVSRRRSIRVRCRNLHERSGGFRPVVKFFCAGRQKESRATNTSGGTFKKIFVLCVLSVSVWLSSVLPLVRPGFNADGSASAICDECISRQ